MEGTGLGVWGCRPPSHRLASPPLLPAPRPPRPAGERQRLSTNPSTHPSIHPCTRASIPLPPLTVWKQGAARWQWQSTGRPAAISARRVPLPGRHFGAGRRREMAAGAAAGRDPRVRCCSRRGLERLLGLCEPFLRALAAGQPGGPAEDDVLWVRRPGRGWGAGEGGREGPAGGGGGVPTPGVLQGRGAEGRGLGP